MLLHAGLQLVLLARRHAAAHMHAAKSFPRDPTLTAGLAVSPDLLAAKCSEAHRVTLEDVASPRPFFFLQGVQTSNSFVFNITWQRCCLEAS